LAALGVQGQARTDHDRQRLLDPVFQAAGNARGVERFVEPAPQPDVIILLQLQVARLEALPVIVVEPFEWLFTHVKGLLSTTLVRLVSFPPTMASWCAPEARSSCGQTLRFPQRAPDESTGRRRSSSTCVTPGSAPSNAITSAQRLSRLMEQSGSARQLDRG